MIRIALNDIWLKLVELNEKHQRGEQLPEFVEFDV